jgi:HEAT repeat protein
VLLILRNHPGQHDRQVEAFRSFLGELGAEGLELRLTDVGLEVQGARVPADAPGAAELAGVLAGHRIGQLRMQPGAGPGSVLAVLRTLATPADHFLSLGALLQDLDAETRSWVAIGGPTLEASGEAAADFVSDEEILAARGADPIGSAPMRHVELERLSAGHLDTLLRVLDEDPLGERVTDTLGRIVAAADAAAREKDWITVTRAAHGVCRHEPQAPEGELRRAYHIAIRRMLTWDAVDFLARRVTGPHRADALEVLRLAGAEAAEALLHLLVDSDSMEDRRSYYAALRQLATVSPLMSRLLGHEEWYVVRNMAELCGDLRADAMVPQLTRHVHHEDERVRRSVAGALAKIATPGTAEALRQMLHDPSPQVRLQAVQGLDGPRAKGLAMPLALALEDESNPDVQRELLLALGRIGTLDAVQAIARVAAPGRRLFNRRPVSLRLAAVEALRLAGTPAASAALSALAGDPDPEVRSAVRQALGQA